MCLVNHIEECKLLARPLQFLMEYGDDPSKKSGLFIDFIQDQIAVPILSKKFQTELNEVLNYMDRIKVQNSNPVSAALIAPISAPTNSFPYQCYNVSLCTSVIRRSCELASRWSTTGNAVVNFTILLSPGLSYLSEGSYSVTLRALFNFI